MSRYTYKLNKQEPIVTIEDFLSMFKRCDCKYAVEGLEFLKNKGLLPLTYESKLLPEINILVAWLNWSGCISKSKKNTLFGYINLRPNNIQTYLPNLEQVVSKLDLNLRNSSKGDIHFGENGSSYARLIHKAGVRICKGSKKHYDTKVNHIITFPEYILFLRDKYDYIHHKDKKIATKILADYIKIILFTKLTKIGKGYRINLNSSVLEQGEEIIRDLGKDVLKLFNKVYSKLNFTQDMISTSKTKRGKRKYSSGHINLRKEHVIEMLYYGLFNISLNNEYYKYGKVVGYSNVS